MFKNKIKILIGLLSLTIILITHNEIVSINLVHASAGQFVKDIGGIDGLNSIVSTVSSLNTFLYTILLVSLNMMQYLMSAEFMTNTKMMGALNSIWVLSRDIVNIMFALMLVGVAVYTIITANTKFVKEKLVHFIMAVILVNFSWFFPRVIIDVSNILTATVFSVPQMLPGAEKCKMIGANGGEQECEVIVDSMILGSQREMYDWCLNVAPKDEPGGKIHCFPHGGFYAVKMMKYSDAIADNALTPATAMLNGLAVSFAKITTLPNVPQLISGTITPTGSADDYLTAANILIVILMTFVFEIAVLLPILGLALGFLIRIVILWVCVAFMPFTFIGLAVKGSLTTNVFGFEMNLWKEFTTAAFLPAAVGAPIAIGFVMMSTVATIPAPGGFPQTFGLPLIGGVSNWWALLWMCASVGILWKGAFDALKRNDIVGKFTEPLRSFGQTVFRAARQLPLLTPLPIPGMPSGTNLGTLVHGPELAQRTLSAATSGTPLDKPIFEKLKENFGMGPNARNIASKLDDQQVNRIVNAINSINKAGDRAAINGGVHELEVALNISAGRMSPDQLMSFTKDVVERGNAEGGDPGKKLGKSMNEVIKAIDKVKGPTK